MLFFLLPFLYRQLFVQPADPKASFQGQTVIVTGANTGLGLEACRSLVARGAARVILACRNVDKGNAAAADIRSTTSCAETTLEVWRLDMCSYESVLAFADRARAELPRLDVLIANAGVLNTAFRMAEADEETVTVNVVSTYLLAFLLHPKLRETSLATGAPTRCSVVGSDTYEFAQLAERKVAPEGGLFRTLADEKEADMDNRYPTTKLMVLLVAREMAAMAPVSSGRVIVNVVNPGMTISGLSRDMGNGLAVRAFYKMIARSTEVGARTLVYGAAVGAESHGMFVPDCRVREPNLGLAGGKTGAQLQRRIWAELREKLEAIRPGVTSIA